MPLVINTNVSSLSAQRSLTANTNALARSMEKLSSGFRITRSADDAAGLQLSENLRAQIRGTKAALNNVQDGINVLNIADGSLSTVTSNLQRMRELAVQAANDTYDATQRNAMNEEYDQLEADINRIFLSTEFNGVRLFDAATSGLTEFNIQVGPNNTANDTIDLVAEGVPFDTTLNTADVAGNGAADVSTGFVNLDNSLNAGNAIAALDDGIRELNGVRATIGAITSRLENAATKLRIDDENLQASESRMRNVDVAAESAELVRNQILQQASASVLSQANQVPSLALSLLG
ncbi:MAG: flagellin [Vampirovibrio sp.]|nr:flagellin [Vampirovibrio sp.]